MLNDSAWIHARLGLATTFERLRTAPCRIAYLGLSVTAQRDGYRTRLHDAIVAETGHAHIAVNAGVGGVGSVSLTFLMNRLVVEHQPALCFIECTTGDTDGRTPLKDVAPAIEGIVRKLRAIGCAACVLHLYQREQPCDHDHPVLDEYERVAMHYGVPTLNVGKMIAHAVAHGHTTAAALLADVVHTRPAGAQSTADLIMRGLRAMAPSACDPSRVAEARGRDAVEAGSDRLTAGQFDHADVTPVSSANCERPPVVGRFRLMYDFVQVDNGNALRVCLPGHAIHGLLVIVGPGSGRVRVESGSHSADYQLWDEWCTYDRLSTLVFSREVAPGVAMRIAPIDGPDTSLRVAGLLTIPSHNSRPASFTTGAFIDVTGGR